jgi:hypothetical protein
VASVAEEDLIPEKDLPKGRQHTPALFYSRPVGALAGLFRRAVTVLSSPLPEGPSGFYLRGDSRRLEVEEVGMGALLNHSSAFDPTNGPRDMNMRADFLNYILSGFEFGKITGGSCSSVIKPVIP